jgi:DNA-binding helix-hairpin-helix protein with protein kinase domain
MGIVNIHLLHEPDDHAYRLALAARQELLIEAHRRGEHPWGRMRRDCPLCQNGR